MNVTNYTVQQVAKMTNKTVDTVRTWVRTGRLKGRKPPGCKNILINKDDFEMFWYGAIQSQ